MGKGDRDGVRGGEGVGKADGDGDEDGNGSGDGDGNGGERWGMVIGEGG